MLGLADEPPSMYDKKMLAKCTGSEVSSLVEFSCSTFRPLILNSLLSVQISSALIH